MRAAKEVGVTVLGPPLDDPVRPPEYRRVLERMRSDNADAVIAGDAAPNYTYRRDVVAITNELHLPTMFPYRAIDIHNLWRRAADCVDELLRGRNVSEVPIYQASKLDLIINSKAAQPLGLAIPSSLALRADEVIE